LGNGDGTFGPARSYPGASGLESAFRISWDIHAADVNLDGTADVVVSNDASNDVSVFLGNGDGTLQPHQRYGVGYSPRFFAVTDFAGAGIPDVASVISLPFNGLNSAVAVLPGLAPRGAPGPGHDTRWGGDAALGLSTETRRNGAGESAQEGTLSSADFPSVDAVSALFTDGYSLATVILGSEGTTPTWFNAGRTRRGDPARLEWFVADWDSRLPG